MDEINILFLAFLGGGVLIGVLVTLNVWVLYKVCIWFYFNVYAPVAIRIGWHQHRAELGHPISWYRSLFGKFPRFGSYERDEVGCPESDVKAYQMVENK